VIESVDDNRTQLRYRVHMEFTMPAGVVIVGLDHPSNGVHEDIYVGDPQRVSGCATPAGDLLRDHPVEQGIVGASQ